MGFVRAGRTPGHPVASDGVVHLPPSRIAGQRRREIEPEVVFLEVQRAVTLGGQRRPRPSVRMVPEEEDTASGDRLTERTRYDARRTCPPVRHMESRRVTRDREGMPGNGGSEL